VQEQPGTELEIVTAPENWQNNSQAAKLRFEKGRYPGISFSHIYGDWSDYTNLRIDVYSSHSGSLPIVLRIHDTLHNNDFDDRYNRQLLIQPGVNRIDIDLNAVRTAPQTRPMQMDNIASMALFTVSPEAPLEIYLDNIHLSDRQSSTSPDQ
jgi:hypothetical protein